MDDRKKFKKIAETNSKNLGKNKKLFSDSINFLTKLDKYRYYYLWSWFGAPIIQLPTDMIAIQEVIYKVKPDIIIETGVARGGSLIYYASILKLLKKKFKVIGIDIDLRLHNVDTIKKSVVAKHIKLISGSSIDNKIITKLKKICKKKKVIVILDSDHSKNHVLNECRSYSSLVSKKSYLIVADTILGYFKKSQTPKKRSQILFKGNEPRSAINEFLNENKKFKIDKTLNGKLLLGCNFGGFLYKK